MAAHTYAYRDHNQKRGMEEWYEYQHKLSKLDKSKIARFDPTSPSEDSKRPNCMHCGHLMQVSKSTELF
jgi:hypothetical protein